MQTLEKSISTRGSTTITSTGGETTGTITAAETTVMDEQLSMPERHLHELETFVGTSIKVYFYFLIKKCIFISKNF
jgi:hypothetical protein